jgi:hypothetical protein
LLAWLAVRALSVRRRAASAGRCRPAWSTWSSTPPTRPRSPCSGRRRSTGRHVRDELLARIDADTTFLEQLTVNDHADERDQIVRQLKTLDQRRAELSRLWALGERTSEEWAAAREVIDEQQTRLNIRLAELPAPDANAVDLSALPTAWPNMTLDERRQALLFARIKVTLWPVATHGKTLDRRVTVEFLVNPETRAPAIAST